MKYFMLAVALAFSASAFAQVPTCRDLAKNTKGIITLKPITTSSNPIEAGGKVVFAALLEGVDIGACTARVTVRGGELVLMGAEGVVGAGFAIVDEAGWLVGQILGDIFGRPRR